MKLPEGWEKVGNYFRREDGQAIVSKTSSSGVWCAGANNCPDFFLPGGWTDPVVAMSTLNIRYPIKEETNGTR